MPPPAIRRDGLITRPAHQRQPASQFSDVVMGSTHILGCRLKPQSNQMLHAVGLRKSSVQPRIGFCISFGPLARCRGWARAFPWGGRDAPQTR
jgi:hypothetical protein